LSINNTIGMARVNNTNDNNKLATRITSINLDPFQHDYFFFVFVIIMTKKVVLKWIQMNANVQNK